MRQEPQNLVGVNWRKLKAEPRDPRWTSMEHFWLDKSALTNNFAHIIIAWWEFCGVYRKRGDAINIAMIF